MQVANESCQDSSNSGGNVWENLSDDSSLHGDVYLHPVTLSPVDTQHGIVNTGYGDRPSWVGAHTHKDRPQKVLSLLTTGKGFHLESCFHSSELSLC